MKLDFVINWGYQMLYSRRLYHRFFCWDGSLLCSDEKAVMKLEQLTYPFVWFGICYSPEKTPVDGNAWHNTVTRRAMAQSLGISTSSSYVTEVIVPADKLTSPCITLYNDPPPRGVNFIVRVSAPKVNSTLSHPDAL